MENKVVHCVSDNAANITKAITILTWTHHPCFAHTIKLFVRDALKVMKAMVGFFHRSTTATEKLKSTQRQMGMPEQRLKHECITRWNVTFSMLGHPYPGCHQCTCQSSEPRGMGGTAGGMHLSGLISQLLLSFVKNQIRHEWK